jgi:hypothetical protein
VAVVVVGKMPRSVTLEQILRTHITKAIYTNAKLNIIFKGEYLKYKTQS